MKRACSHQRRPAGLLGLTALLRRSRCLFILVFAVFLGHEIGEGVVELFGVPRPGAGLVFPVLNVFTELGHKFHVVPRQASPLMPPQVAKAVSVDSTAATRSHASLT